MNLNLILGGTTIHNSKSFLNEVQAIFESSSEEDPHF
jgi:hypothetical protein